jgi:hypothetical protein
MVAGARISPVAPLWGEPRSLSQSIDGGSALTARMREYAASEIDDLEAGAARPGKQNA